MASVRSLRGRTSGEEEVQDSRSVFLCEVCVCLHMHAHVHTYIETKVNAAVVSQKLSIHLTFNFVRIVF